MEYDFLQQTNAFLLSLILGLSFWVLYEIVKLFRIILNIKGLILFFVDLIFMIICSISTFYFALALLNGSVRLFIILGIGISFFTMRFTIGILIDKPLCNSITILKKFFNKNINLFKKIIKKLLKILYKVLYNVYEKICKFVSFFKNAFKLINLNKKGNKYGKQKERNCQEAE